MTGPIIIPGPIAYEINYCRTAEILAACVAASFQPEAKLDERMMRIIHIMNELRKRMQDRMKLPMICMTCDHQFKRREPPTEVVIAIPWASKDHPPIVCAICRDCATADTATKMERVRAHWSKLSPGATFSYEAPGTS